MWLPADIDGEMDGRLKNWGDYCRMPSRSRLTVARGVEGRYRPCDEPDFEPEPYARTSPWAEVVDPADAEVINGVVMVPAFPEWHRRMLIGHYRDQVHPRKLFRALGIRWVEYNRVLGAALVVVRNRLPKPERLTMDNRGGYDPAHNSTSASSRGVHGAAEGCVAPVRQSNEALQA